MDEIIFIDNLPTLDLHGYDRDTARVATLDFIRDNIKMKNKYIVIIHGKGKFIVKNAVYETIKNCKYVEDYKLYNFNTGCTILKIMLDK